MFYIADGKYTSFTIIVEKQPISVVKNINSESTLLGFESQYQTYWLCDIHQVIQPVPQVPHL